MPRPKAVNRPGSSSAGGLLGKFLSAGDSIALGALQDIIEVLPDAIAIFDPGERLRLFNSRYPEIMRPEFPDAVEHGMTLEEIVAGERVDAALVQHRAAPGVREVELPGGRWIRITKQPAGDGWVVGTYTDISAVKEREDRFANMSHEIRTPLNGILGMVNLMQTTDLSIEQLNYVETLQSSANNLLDLVNDILDMSKMEAGAARLSMSEFDLHGLMQEVVTALSPLAGNKGIALRAEIVPELSGAFIGDRNRVRQVLLNLAGNAIKFTEKGQVIIWAMLENRDASRLTVHFDVTDTGIGISEDVRAAIFSRFNRGESTPPPKPGGTGLGLMISKELVELMRGRIGVVSEPGRGSTFWFEIPLVQAGAEDRGAPPCAPADPAVDMRTLKVLVADDNDINRFFISTLLTKAGHMVKLVGDGKAAVEAVRSGNFDVVLMDIHMPVMNGMDATREIRGLEDECRNVPIIALTASTGLGERERHLAQGMNQFIGKPIDVEALSAALCETTGKHVWLQKPAAPHANPSDRKADGKAEEALEKLIRLIDEIISAKG